MLRNGCVPDRIFIDVLEKARKVIMKKLSLLMCVFCLFFSLGLTACAGEKKYALSVYGEELLYEELQDEYPAGQEVRVKVKITPHTTTVAYLDLIPLTRVKGTQDDFYTFTFTMPDRSADLRVEAKRGFEEDLLTGFYLTFRDKNSNPIENLNQDFDSPEAIVWYYYSYTDEENGIEVITSNRADVLNGTAKQFVDTAWGLKELQLECTLYYTYELLDAAAVVDWVYFNTESREFSLSGGYGQTLSGTFSTNMTQKIYEERYNAAGDEYKATFDANVEIIFEYIDYLTGVKIMEYDKDGQLIKTSEFTGKNRSETFTVGESCEYAVIEEEYTVMIGEQKDEKHYERTMVEKTAVKNGKTLKYVRGDGLISPVRLEIIW